MQTSEISDYQASRLDAEKEKYELNSEAFGSTRMLLALVDDREVFDAMVAGVGKKIGRASCRERV